MNCTFLFIGAQQAPIGGVSGNLPGATGLGLLAYHDEEGWCWFTTAGVP